MLLEKSAFLKILVPVMIVTCIFCFLFDFLFGWAFGFSLFFKFYFPLYLLTWLYKAKLNRKYRVPIHIPPTLSQITAPTINVAHQNVTVSERTLTCYQPIHSFIRLDFFFFWAVPHCLQDLSFPTRNWTPALGSKSTVLTTGPPGSSLGFSLDVACSFYWFSQMCDDLSIIISYRIVYLP